MIDNRQAHNHNLPFPYQRFQAIFLHRHITETGSLRSANPTYTLYPINIAVQSHPIAFRRLTAFQPYCVPVSAFAFRLTQWLQYNKTYTVAYEESANRRIVLAEKLRKLPLSFFGQRDLSDLTTTIMGDCTALERVFSNAIPQLFGTIFMFIITAIGLLVLDWRMGLCIVVPVPVAALVVFAAKKAQSNAESANMDAKRAAYDGVQEYLDTIQELKSCSREEEYLEGLEKKLDYVVKCSFRNEIAPGAATTTAQFILSSFGLVLWRSCW